MGKLRILATGSFDTLDETFSAQRRGHTVAVDDAILYLEKFREKSRQRDLKLRSDGHVPDDNFAEAYARGFLNRRGET